MAPATRLPAQLVTPATMDTLYTTCGTNGIITGPWGTTYQVSPKPGPVFVEVDVETVDHKPYAGNTNILTFFSLGANLYYRDATGQELSVSYKKLVTSASPVRAQFDVTAADVAKYKSLLIKVTDPRFNGDRAWSGHCRYLHAGTTGMTTPLRPNVPKTPYKQTFACGRSSTVLTDKQDDLVSTHRFKFSASYPSRITFRVTHNYVARPDAFGRPDLDKRFQALLSARWYNTTSGKATVPVVTHDLTLDDGMRGEEDWQVTVMDYFSRLPESDIPDYPKWKGICELTVDVPFPITVSKLAIEPDPVEAQRMVVTFVLANVGGMWVPRYELDWLDFMFKDAAGNDVSDHVQKRKTTSTIEHSGGPEAVRVVYDLIGTRPSGVVILTPHFNRTYSDPTLASPTRELVSRQSFRATIPPDMSSVIVKEKPTGLELMGRSKGMIGASGSGSPPPIEPTDSAGGKPPLGAPPRKAPPPAPPPASPPAKMPSPPPAIADSASSPTSGCAGGCFDATGNSDDASFTLHGPAVVNVDDGSRFELVLGRMESKAPYVSFAREPGGSPKPGTYSITDQCSELPAATGAMPFTAQFVSRAYEPDATTYLSAGGSLVLDRAAAGRLVGRFTLVACRYDAEGNRHEVHVRGTFDAMR